MKPFTHLLTLSLLPAIQAKLLLDFNATRGDDPSTLGTLNLEAERGDKPDSNSDELYIKLGEDPDGNPALHFHRDEGYIRAEYHALKDEMESDTTYYIGYSLSMAQLQQSLMIWQFKEYSAYTDGSGGANIPLSLEVKEDALNFRYQASADDGRETQWSVVPELNTPHHIGLVINTSDDGWVELYWDGEKQEFDTTGETRLSATTFPGQAEPKFGAYRGEEVEIDTYVYAIQIGTEMEDIVEAAGL
ncbi:hypothetical protein FE257_011432 [Aspergillus nanangensis]|uniref:Uncharacterized protein n=1 Tax=Aspergillus nanangensis TaxID=2582783 RepID=A0AAD4GRG6_ASPNN|nr:hypothetical protein FE257_011432 [Aspergillus nanangensis]